MNSIKAILKLIFPIVFLKRTFVFLNALKAKTIDRILFPELTVNASQYRIYEYKNPFLEREIDVTKFPADIRSKLSIWTDPAWTQDQYLFEYNEPGYLEPSTGWCVTMRRQLVYPSLGFSRAPHVHKPSFTQTYFRKKRVTAITKVISLRDTGEENYFHFYNDVLAKLFFLAKNGIELDKYKVIVSERLARKAYFRQFLRHPFLASLNWHVQGTDEWVHFQSAVFCKPYTHTKDSFDQALSLIDVPIPAGPDRRIFLSRSTKSLRYIENMNELQPILGKFGFEIIDTATLTLQEQAVLFGHCRYLVGIHGAGLTNIIFRRGLKMSMIELASPMSYLPFHYIMLAGLYGIDYDAVLGQPGRDSGAGGFIVAPGVLEARLKKMLDSDE